MEQQRSIADELPTTTSAVIRHTWRTEVMKWVLLAYLRLVVVWSIHVWPNWTRRMYKRLMNTAVRTISVKPARGD
jgi:hypothetical protein